ncbi:hypothetical protein BN971_03688 [Mycobacterium bohemicum DSM 44277]|uniref:Uncharacterized protein n=1 Tax=Mycobacterium bohemicum DSM 44277 TaxID=1236609 RepID=A0A0U0WBK8_MYCBE|nr:hypothetical protein BN971_03688 [Mycobacterium bohemicum DSM 44277]
MPALMPAAVVPAPPWWTAARPTRRQHGRVVHRGHHPDVIETRRAAEVVGAGANQRPLPQLPTRGTDHAGRLCRRRDRRAAQPEADRRCARRDPRRHLVVVIGRQFQRQPADKGPAGGSVPPRVRQPRQAKVLVGLDLQRHRRGLGGLRQAEGAALDVGGLAGHARLQHPGRQDLRREEVHPRQRNTLALGNIGHELLLVHARQQHVGPGRQRRQGLAFGRPRPGELLHDLGQRADRIRHVGNDLRERAHPFAGVRTIGDRVEARRLDQRQAVGRHRHAHVVAAALQLARHGGAGLHVAAAAVSDHHNLHRDANLSVPARARPRGQKVEDRPTRAACLTVCI